MPLLRRKPRYTSGHRHMYGEPFGQYFWYSSLGGKGRISPSSIIILCSADSPSRYPTSYVRIALHLFRIDAPNGIGGSQQH